MTDASLNDIYKLVGELNGTVKGIDVRMDRADESRAKIYDRIDEMAQRETRIEGEVGALKTQVAAISAKVDAQQSVTDEVRIVRDRVIFAGRLGRLLWMIGKALTAAAAGAMTYYYMFTGKTPP